MGKDLVYMYYGTLVVVQSLSHVPFFATLWTLPLLALLSMEFSRERLLQWVSISFSKGSSCHGIEPMSSLTGRFFATESPRKTYGMLLSHKKKIMPLAGNMKGIILIKVRKKNAL